MNIILSLTIGELLSAYPTQGSLYTITYLLSPKIYCKQISLVTGYLIIISN